MHENFRRSEGKLIQAEGMVKLQKLLKLQKHLINYQKTKNIL